MYIPDGYGVPAQALGEKYLPQSQLHREKLLHLANMLDGCPFVQQRICDLDCSKERAARRRAAISPATDHWGLFEWRLGASLVDLKKLHAEGFELANSDQGLNHCRRSAAEDNFSRWAWSLFC